MRNIVQKYSNGTALIKNAVLNTDGNAPDPRISMGFGVGENGEIRHYNNPNDPMPIKTINMNGIKKWEETDDYIIYVDKDAVMTTVQQYVTGTYDLFLERKADVDGSMELLKENGIEWTAEDDSKLLQDINLVQLERIASTPATMDEPTEIQTFETRTVPTTYECCFRTDKKSGEIYIGEGYENYGLLRKSVLNNLLFGANLSHVTDTIDGITIDIPSGTFLESNAGTYGFLYRRQLSGFAVESDYFTVGFEFKITEGKTSVYNHAFGTKRLDNPDTVLATSTFNNFGISIFPDNIKPGESTTERIVVKILKHNATKTSTPKPFVKSVMPSGKLSFVTNATSETHSICVKGVGNPVSVIDGSLTDIKTLFRNGNKLISTGYPSRYDAKFNDIRTRDLWLNSGDVLFSNHYLGAMLNGNKVGTVKDVGSYGSGASEGEIMMSCNQYNKHTPTSFKQLLIYKGNLTEAELKAENEKEIKLERLYSLDDQVSLNFKCDENGLQHYNNPNDPMPIKTRNMNGLQKWEETDDYIIYVDKDAVMTTVQQYVTGTYDLFLERKADVDGSMELLKENGIKWTAEDDSKLLQDINLTQLERIASTPTTMDELTEIQTFEARTVPTTYECCFRTDKKTGEIYIGEGYENLLVKKGASTSNYEINQNLEENIITYNVINSYTQKSSLPLVSSNVSIINCFFSLDILKNTFNRTVSPSGYSGFYPPIGKHERIITNTGGWTHAVTLFNWGSDVFTDVQAGEQIIIKNAMVVNSLTPKPFVKSVMPSGKLSFVTNATSETHSFVVKERLCSNDNWGFANKKEVLLVDLGVDSDALLSNLYTNCMLNFEEANVYDGFCLNIWKRPVRGHSSFKQLLIYKGNLTESELKTGKTWRTEIKESWHNPDKSINSAIAVEKTKLAIPHRHDEQSPIKTMDMEGLKIWEEADDYAIYVDKNAIMTTVENYVTGAYDLFLERRKSVESSIDLLRSYGIDWGSEEDSNLLLDSNASLLEKLFEEPLTLDENGEVENARSFSTKVIPTTYESCFRVDKNTGEIYIGEGYENLRSSYVRLNFTYSQGSNQSFSNIIITNKASISIYDFDLKHENGVVECDKIYETTTYSAEIEKTVSNDQAYMEWQNSGIYKKPGHTAKKIIEDITVNGAYHNSFVFGEEVKSLCIRAWDASLFYPVAETVKSFVINKMQLTKTSTPKPFVRSVMPVSKMALLKIEEFGAITSKEVTGNNLVVQHENGTAIISDPIIDENMPDSRISLGFSADKNGLQYYNNPNDPMPIKTRNMAGLQKWEETDDYIIYVDKDAVMTTVQNYVSGTYDLFLERKADVDGAMELLKENGIEWTAEDDSKLLQDINLAQLERVASTPTTMDELTEIQTFESRTVPTTYECCFRTDKKTGEIYVGEGYENLFFRYRDRKVYDYTVSTISDTTTITTKDDGDSEDFGYGPESLGGFFVNFSFECEKINGGDWISSEGSKGNMLQIFEKDSTTRFFDFSKYQQSDWRARCKFYNLNLSEAQDSIVLKNVQITKTSTPKPFVKSVMPSGKLSFVTNATSETHSFVEKGIGEVTNSTYGAIIFGRTRSSGGEYFQLSGGAIMDSKQVIFENALISKLYKEIQLKDGTFVKINIGNETILKGGTLEVAWQNKSQCVSSFKQLLIYKGNLTEAELKAENGKQINVGAYYHQENSIVNEYGVKGFKKLAFYSPALTTEKVTSEIGKMIRVDQLDFNPNSIKRYLSNLEEFEQVRVYSPPLTEAEIVEELEKNEKPLFRNTNGIPNSQGESLDHETFNKVPTIGGSFDDENKAGIYSSWWIDENEKNERVGTRIAWKK